MLVLQGALLVANSERYEKGFLALNKQLDNSLAFLKTTKQIVVLAMAGILALSGLFYTCSFSKTGLFFATIGLGLMVAGGDNCWTGGQDGALYEMKAILILACSIYAHLNTRIYQIKAN